MVKKKNWRNIFYSILTYVLVKTLKSFIRKIISCNFVRQYKYLSFQSRSRRMSCSPIFYFNPDENMSVYFDGTRRVVADRLKTTLEERSEHAR